VRRLVTDELQWAEQGIGGGDAPVHMRRCDWFRGLHRGVVVL
jgi:hypothetical protein